MLEKDKDKDGTELEVLINRHRRDLHDDIIRKREKEREREIREMRVCGIIAVSIDRVCIQQQHYYYYTN